MTNWYLICKIMLSTTSATNKKTTLLFSSKHKICSPKSLKLPHTVATFTNIIKITELVYMIYTSALRCTTTPSAPL